MDDVVLYQLEKLRRHADSTYSSPSATQWLRKSYYSNEMIIDEETVIFCLGEDEDNPNKPKF